MKRTLVAALLIAVSTAGSSGLASRSIFVSQTADTSAQKLNSQKPDPPKTDQEKIDPKKLDPKKTNPHKLDPQKVDPQKVDPQKVDPQKVDPQKVDPQKVDPQKVDPRKVDPRKVDPQKVDPQKVDPQKVDPGKSGPLKANPQPEPPTFRIDPNLKARMGTVPGIDRGPDRPLATVTDAKGNQADFVLNELIVSSDDMAEVNGLVGRWRGRILHTISFDRIKLKRGTLRGLPRLHLIKIDPAGADASSISKDLRMVDPHCRGQLRISSEAGLKVLAVAASEAANQKIKVLLNWVMYNSDLTTGVTSEHPAGAEGYNPNAFQWPYMNRGSSQDIGVAAAWQALAVSGRLSNRVRIMVADGGFTINEDLPASREHFGTGDWGTRSFIDCAVGSASCRWHGTDVVGTAMARFDNRFGVAGPAGPVAELIAFGRAADFFEFFYSFFESLAALGAGPDIVNISAGARIPAAAAIFADPVLSAIYGVMRLAGTLVFAAAGNEGQDVDAEDCFGFCWEEAAWLPCEAGSVICVGGMDWNTTARHPDSNWGSKHESASVDIWGPFVVWGYNEPVLGDYSARKIYGTSFACPFVAGVAALVWAADPGLSPTRVWEIMEETAHHGGVFPYSHPDLRVNAFAAVRRALGDANLPPSLTLRLAGDSSSPAPLNRGVNLHASAADAEDGTPCCTVTWNFRPSYSTDSGRNATFVFNTTGPKTITATATDRGGATQVASLIIDVTNTPPLANIEQPLIGSDAYVGQAVRLLGSATDRNEGLGPGPGNLDCRNLRWTSSNPADRFPVSGCDANVTFEVLGRRTLTLTAQDPQGASGTTSVEINVLARPGNFPPTISLGTLPPFSYESGYRWDRTFVVTASAIDPERDVPLTFRWIARSYYPDSSRVFAGVVEITAGSILSNLNWTPSRTPSLFISNCSTRGSYSGQVVKLTLEATDSRGNRSTRTLRDIKVYRCFLI